MLSIVPPWGWPSTGAFRPTCSTSDSGVDALANSLRFIMTSVTYRDRSLELNNPRSLICRELASFVSHVYAPSYFLANKHVP